MIHRADLRPGNHIIIDSCTVEVEDLQPKYCIAVKELGGFVVSAYDKITPVPLTYQVFIEWGFHRENFAWQKGTFTLFDPNSCDHSKVSSIALMFGSLSSCRVIKNLHELQNLYFWIEGKELRSEQLNRISA